MCVSKVLLLQPYYPGHLHANSELSFSRCLKQRKHIQGIFCSGIAPCLYSRLLCTKFPHREVMKKPAETNLTVGGCLHLSVLSPASL